MSKAHSNKRPSPEEIYEAAWKVVENINKPNFTEDDVKDTLNEVLLEMAEHIGDLKGIDVVGVDMKRGIATVEFKFDDYEGQPNFFSF